MKQLSIILAALIIGGLIIYVGIYKKPELKSAITGEVRLGPTCPGAERSTPGTDECSDKLFETKLQLVNPDTEAVIKDFSSDSNGKFSVEVEPGEYMIRSVPSGKPFPHCGKSGVVVVTENKTVKVTVLCDTGIR